MSLKKESFTAAGGRTKQPAFTPCFKDYKQASFHISVGV